MFPHYGYMPGPEYGPGQNQMPVDPSSTPGRFDYTSYYPKGHPSSHYGGMAAAAGHPYGGKPRNMVGPEAMYTPNWSSMMQGPGYMSAPGSKSSMGNPYAMQVDMYGGVPPPPNQTGYPESLPPPGMGGYPAGATPAGYTGGPPHQYSSRGQYSSYSSHSRSIPHPTHTSSTPGASNSTQELSNAASNNAPSIDGFQGNIPPPSMQYPQGAPPSCEAQWNSASTPRAGRTWTEGGQNSSQSQSSWQQGTYRGSEEFHGGRSSTPGQQQLSQSVDGGGKTPQPSSVPPQVHTPVTQTPGLIKQSSQSSFSSARSPQTPFNNPELTKQSSISSLRDALLATSTASPSGGPQHPQYNSPRMSVDHQASPSGNIAHTPEAVATPVGASSSVLSPAMQGPSPAQHDLQHQLSSAPSEPELVQPFPQHSSNDMVGASTPVAAGGGGSRGGENRGVSPFQVETILGIKNDKPIDAVHHPLARMPGLQHQSSLTNSVGAQSPHDASHVEPYPVQTDGGVRNSQENQALRRPGSLGYMSPYTDHSSPVTETDKNVKQTAVMSPVTRNHPSILGQYQYSNEGKRKEFLDSLFTYLEKEGIPLLRLPMICKAPLDLYRAFNSVQQLGGFINVMEKRLWRDVLKSVSNGAANPNSGALRTLQQYYTRVLLPYECHIRNVDIASCLSKLENSVSLHSSISSPSSQLSSSDNERVNHYPHLSSVDSNSMESLSDLRVNGESDEHQSKKPLQTENRLNSQGSDTGLVNNSGSSGTPAGGGGGGMNESQIVSSNATPEGRGVLSQQSSQQQALGIEQTSQHGQSGTTAAGLDIPDGSQNSLDNYSQVITEPLPEMSVQDAESVLGMSPAPYPNQQQQQQPPGGPATPSAIQNAPSPSHYPPHFPQHSNVTPSGGGPPGTPGATQEYMEMSEMGRSSTPGMSASPSLYPPSYPMDPMSGYPQSHPPSMPPGYHHPYNSPSAHGQYDMSHDFHHRMQSSMMRQPYANGSPHYPGIPPSMSIPGHIPPSMDYPGYHRSSVMPPHAGPMGMREIPPYPGPPSMASEWQWRRQQQQQHQRSRVIPPLPAHLHSSAAVAAYQSSLHERRQAAMMAAMQQHQQQQMHNRSSPGINNPSSGSSDAIKIHWQEQNKTGSSSQLNKLQEKTNSLAVKQALTHKIDATNENKALSSKTMEQAEMLKRRLPDWSNCVEGTRPHLVKRRRLFSGDCGHVEPWRVMMSLKSGLLAESTWALDTLNILLHDDRTVGFFYLKHHHSLLNTLVDHFKVTLEAIFGIKFDDLSMYLTDHPGCDPAPRTVDGEKENHEKYTTEWLINSTHTDYDALNSDTQKGNDESSESSIPVARVFDSSLVKLGKSDNLSHIHIPRNDEQLFFPLSECELNIMPEKKRKELEDVGRLQRIDQTPVSYLMHREALLSQIPLHRFGRLSRSPRRREKSFLDEMRRRESLSRIEESKNSSSGSSKTPLTPTSAATPCGSNVVQDSKLSSEDVFSSPEPLAKNSPPKFMREECEIHRKEALPLWSISPSQEQLQRRCMCISNILRSLSFIPGNDIEFSQHPNILIVLGQLLMLHHHHLISSKERKHLSNLKGDVAASCAASLGEESPIKHEEQQFKPFTDYWWWDCIEMLQENTLVILSNISGQLDLSVFPELITYPIVKGLLHWCVCPSAHATDPLPDTAMVSSLSPQRLVIETLAKVSISEVNVDFILATPPLPQLDLLFARLGEFIGQKKHPVVRQFALVLLSNLCQGSEAASRVIGQQKMIVSLLLECLEVAEHTACMSSGRMIGGYNPEDPNSLSIAMLRRAATTLHCISKVPANRTCFLPYHDRMLYLATSQFVEHSVSSILMDMLFEFGKL